MKVYSTDWELTRDLAQPFPSRLIQKAPQGKHGDYINHADIAQRLLSVVGPYSFEVTEVIRGLAPQIQSSRNTYEARADAVLGCLATLTIIDSGGTHYSITEVGTEDNPAMSHDAENLKNAASDAFKRCAMRLGVGLQLWAKEGYWLPGRVAETRFPEPKPKAPSKITKVAETPVKAS